MKPKNFVPGSKPLFDNWQDNLITKVNLYKTNWNWDSDTSAEWLQLIPKKTRWDNIWAVIKTKVFTHPQEEEMKAAFKDYVSGNRNDPNDTSIRIFITRHIRYNKKVTEEQKRDIGITVPDTTSTPISAESMKTGSQELNGHVRKYDHLLHVTEWMTAGKRIKGKDSNVAEISVFMTITEVSVKTAPALSLFQYVGEVSRGLYMHTFDDDQEGMRAWYYACNKIKGRKKIYGPPSTVFSAVIP